MKVRTSNFEMLNGWLGFDSIKLVLSSQNTSAACSYTCIHCNSYALLKAFLEHWRMSSSSHSMCETKSSIFETSKTWMIQIESQAHGNRLN